MTNHDGGDHRSLFDKLLVPIVVGVGIAILAGGTSPWWFDELFGDETNTPEGNDTTSPTTSQPRETTTLASTTTTSEPPGAMPDQVMLVTVGLAGGSAEVFVTWDESPEPDVTHYLVYCSDQIDGTYEQVKYFDPDLDNDPNTDPGRLGFVHSPPVGEGCLSCFTVTAVNIQGRESIPSDPGCFNPNA